MKTLRVLLVEECQDNAWTIEKILNSFGCYGIAVARDLNEAVDFIDFPGKHFDVAILNSKIIEGDIDGVAARSVISSVSCSLVFHENGDKAVSDGFYAGRGCFSRAIQITL